MFHPCDAAIASVATAGGHFLLAKSKTRGNAQSNACQISAELHYLKNSLGTSLQMICMIGNRIHFFRETPWLKSTAYSWQMLLAQSFVSSNPSLRFCPAPSCNQTLQCTSVPIGSSTLLTTVPTLSCSKGHVVCFGCGMENGHCPVICKIASLWVASKDDAGTSKWIEANTRRCPKCSNNIEKAGGCKYVLFFYSLFRTILTVV